jgi:hypothetical protein
MERWRWRDGEIRSYLCELVVDNPQMIPGGHGTEALQVDDI